MKDLLYKKSNNLRIKIASPILEIPFLAHNSEFVGESKINEDRMRVWVVNLGNIDFKNFLQLKDKNEESLDEYDWFRLVIDSIGLKVMYTLLIFSLVYQERNRSKMSSRCLTNIRHWN